MKISLESGVSSGSGEAVLDNVLEELANRLQAGEPVDYDAIVAHYPEHADSLRRLLPTMELMAQLGTSAGRGAPARSRLLGIVEEPEAGLGLLGDFRIVKEVGRGGMGVVYEAEQLSLGRRVALKVLPMAAALDAEQLRRFKAEAQAAAQLHHTHIVPVYSVGCERGVHYYAMQLIEGQTLAQAIRARQRPEEARLAGAISSTVLLPGGLDRGTASTAVSGRASEWFRTVARLGIQIAEALDFAHRFGVVHRDIKPANILLDAEGNAWISDFGLARLQDDSALTITGEMIGTLRYMSPEQALSKRGVLDHRTDIYSLAATLYEVLTLCRAVDGQDRQEVLRKLQHESPKSLRKIDPAIPRELETILLKAMSKEPDGRYETAQDLAADLRRFLDHIPIKAKPPSWALRIRKWSRRHRAIVVTASASTALALVLAVAGLAIANLRIQREQARTDAERGRAEANLRKAQAAVDRMYTRASEELVNVPRTEELRRKLLLEALEFYQAFIKEKSGDPILRHETARACLRVARIYRMPMFGIGLSGEAGPPLRQAIGLLDQLVIEAPENTAFAEDLADSHGLLGLTHFLDGRFDEAIAERRRELAIRESLARNFPAVTDFRRRFARALIDAGNIFMDAGRLDEALDYDRKALAVWMVLKGELGAPHSRDWDDEAHIRHWLGRAHLGSQQLSEAERELRVAMGLREKLIAIEPRRADFQGRLAHNQCDLGLVLQNKGEAGLAVPLFERAIAIHEKLIDDFPDVAEHQRRLGWVYSALGDSLLALERDSEAFDAFRRSLTVREARGGAAG